jgi:hypothetical protein
LEGTNSRGVPSIYSYTYFLSQWLVDQVLVKVMYLNAVVAIWSESNLSKSWIVHEIYYPNVHVTM